jgi:hypothetical protein
MASLPLYLLLLALLAILPLLCLARRRAANRLRLPPSSWSLPLLGHLHHLAQDLPRHAMRDQLILVWK